MRSSENLTLRQRQLLYRAWHRGIREMDLILGRFADHEIENYDDAALDQFEILLEVTDKELFSWITGDQSVPAEHQTDLCQRLITFNHEISR